MQQNERLQQALEDLREGRGLVPQQSEIFVGDGDYLAISAEFLDYFVNVGGLQPDHYVLDMGSGIGRMTCGISRYLDPAAGSYLGIDPVKSGVDWCQGAYGANYPHFHFRHVDLQNDLYNPAGSIAADRFAFPVRDQGIDFAILTSVFTHLHDSEIAHYLRELGRCLGPRGTLFATVYAYDGDAPLLENVPPHLNFQVQAPDSAFRWYAKDFPPLAAVCFQQDWLSNFAASAFGRAVTILPGRWRGGAGPWYQDLMLSRSDV